jgi:hypothetical protein
MIADMRGNSKGNISVTGNNLKSKRHRKTLPTHSSHMYVGLRRAYRWTHRKPDAVTPGGLGPKGVGAMRLLVYSFMAAL